MYKSPFDIDYSLPNCEGLMCENRGNLFKLVHWSNPDKVNWFCSKCFKISLSHEEEEKKRFLDYYKHPETREWLSPKLLDLYNRLSKESRN